jgi:DNA-binding transcriptional regulator YhcF (GntR family)
MTVINYATYLEINNEMKLDGILSNIFSSRAVAQILDFFLDHKEFDYSPAEVAQKSGLSFRTVFREIPNLEKNQLIYHSRKIGKTNMYKLNTDLHATLLLEKFVLEMSQLGRSTQEEIKTIPNTTRSSTIVEEKNGD